jgi:hypothetical protein
VKSQRIGIVPDSRISFHLVGNHLLNIDSSPISVVSWLCDLGQVT